MTACCEPFHKGPAGPWKKTRPRQGQFHVPRRSTGIGRCKAGHGPRAGSGARPRMGRARDCALAPTAAVPDPIAPSARSGPRSVGRRRQAAAPREVLNGGVGEGRVRRPRGRPWRAPSACYPRPSEGLTAPIRCSPIAWCRPDREICAGGALRRWQSAGRPCSDCALGQRYAQTGVGDEHNAPRNAIADAHETQCEGRATCSHRPCNEVQP